jgi:transcriptional regulator with XRE-family HTH domain
MNSKLTTNSSKLWVRLAEPEYRNALVSSTIAARIAVRIYNLRKKLGWTQTKLADEAEMKQARISLLEQADYENCSINTLKRIAAAFNVAVIVDFVSFRDFIKWSSDIDSESAAPQCFDESRPRK